MTFFVPGWYWRLSLGLQTLGQPSLPNALFPFYFETGSHWVAQTGLELTISLCQLRWRAGFSGPQFPAQLKKIILFVYMEWCLHRNINETKWRCKMILKNEPVDVLFVSLRGIASNNQNPNIPTTLTSSLHGRPSLGSASSPCVCHSAYGRSSFQPLFFSPR